MDPSIHSKRDIAGQLGVWRWMIPDCWLGLQAAEGVQRVTQSEEDKVRAKDNIGSSVDGKALKPHSSRIQEKCSFLVRPWGRGGTDTLLWTSKNGCVLKAPG